MLAAIGGHAPVAALLVVDGAADVNETDYDDLTALHHAVARGHVAVADAIVSVPSADITLRTPDDRTALNIATDRNDRLMMDVLEQRGLSSESVGDTAGESGSPSLLVGQAAAGFGAVHGMADGPRAGGGKAGKSARKGQKATSRKRRRLFFRRRNQPSSSTATDATASSLSVSTAQPETPSAAAQRVLV